MIHGIWFNDETFDRTSDNNIMYPLTKDTLVLCSDYQLMNFLANDIMTAINYENTDNDYDCDESDIGKAKYELNFGLQKVIDVNGQRITLCLEPAMIYRVKHISDIWFAEWVNIDCEIKKSVYPMTAFIGSNELWNKGLVEVYQAIVCGKCGGYNGSWVKL